MNPDADTLTLIRTSFPDRDDLIEHTFRRSESFRSVCEDYRECIAVLERWKQRETAEAPFRRQEYAELLVELGREIQIWLEALEKNGAPEEDTDRE